MTRPRTERDRDRDQLALGEQQARLDNTDQDDDVDEDDPCDSPEWCDGPAALEDGELCCFGCWLAADDEQIQAYDEAKSTGEPAGKLKLSEAEP